MTPISSVTRPAAAGRKASQRPRRPWLMRLAWCGVIALLLAGSFALYLRPEFMQTMADQIWACF